MSTVFEKRSSRSLMGLVDLLIAIRLKYISRRLIAQRSFPLVIYANEFIGIHINTFGYYEKEELDILFSFFEPMKEIFSNGLALDVGANIGNHSLYFSKNFNRVHSFEPNPKTHEILIINTREQASIVCHNYGLGERVGDFSMQVHDDNVGAAKILKENFKSDRDAIDVQIQRLDNIDIDMSALCFIKIDVEGYEANVIKGGMATIRRYQPIIAFEQFESDFADGSTESIRLLTELGYVFCWHQNGIASTSRILRSFVSILELCIGRKQSILCKKSVPPGQYSLIIAVPIKYFNILNIKCDI